jgi:hypothetical protein
MSMELPARTEVWVRLIGAITSDQAAKIKCDPSAIDFDELKELVKAKCQIELAAFRLKVKKNARDYWKNSARVSNATDCEDPESRRGGDEGTPLEVEVPAALLVQEVPPAQGEPPSNKFLFYLNLHFLAICRVPTVFFTFAPLLSISPITQAPAPEAPGN